MYEINLITYLDKCNIYKKIFIISPEPFGKIKLICKQISPQKLSPFETYNQCTNRCLFAIMNPNNTNEFLCIEQTDILINYLEEIFYLLIIIKLMNH